MTDGNIFDATQVRHAALLTELQTQRTFLGDRAVNLAADLAVAEATIEQLRGRVSDLEKELHQCKNPELPSETSPPAGGDR